VSVWLQDGVSGVGAHAGIAVDDSSTSFNVSGGYSYLGVLEVTVGLSNVTYNNDNPIASDLGAYGGIVGVQYHPLKQGPNMPISLGLGIGVPVLKLTSAQLDDAGITGSAWGIGTLIEVYRFIKLTPNIGVTPSIALDYTYTHVSFGNMAGDEVTQSDNVLGVGLTSYFGFLGPMGAIYGFAPSLGLGDHISFSVNVGMIWPLK